ncbi:MAG: hypothetical protein MJ252_07245 [archaeon]|nr:hypothetical protein [archaeon]
MKLFITLILLLFNFIFTQGCNYSNCPPLQGVCFNNQCICGKGYATVNNEYINSNGISCNYKTKSQFIAFLLEFFFPIGVGHLYSERTLMASIKFGIFVFFLIGFCSELCLLKTAMNKCIICLSIFFILDIIIWFGIQLVDLCGFALGFYKDGHGVPFD